MINTLNLRKILLLGGDFILLYTSLSIMIFLEFGKEFNWQIFSFHLLPFSILYFFWLIIFYIFGFYDLKIIRTDPSFYAKFLGAILTGLAVGMVFFYLIPFFGIAPKTNLILNVLIFGVLFFCWRKLFYLLFSFRFLNKTTIIGDNAQIQELTKEIINRPYLGYKLVNLDLKKDLLPQIQKEKIDTLIITNDFGSNSWLTKNLYKCLPARINFIDWTKAYELICEKIPITFLAQAWFLENLKEGEKGFYDKAKRGMDIILATILLIITTPFLPFIALAIKIEDKESIFYRQERIGRDRKPFLLFKFRSMKSGAESKTGPVWAKEEDPRVTKVGKWLRRFHLDELPQMINVLKGDISLVGPRPERPEFIEQLEKKIPHYHIRHLIRPGFSGWAQLKFRYGRSIMDSHEKFQYDLYYLKNRSFFLDLGILLKTFQLFFKKD
ncbi:MAG: sugar transferase [Candidatus Nealsonbacteria bacterium]